MPAQLDSLTVAKPQTGMHPVVASPVGKKSH